MSETGTVCTFGGLNIPPVTDFMVGFQNGVDYYNAQKGAEVEVLGWDNAAKDGAFTGNFEFTDDGRRFAENFFDEGCDVIMPVAGPVGLGSAAAAAGARPGRDRRGHRLVRLCAGVRRRLADLHAEEHGHGRLRHHQGGAWTAP